MRTVYLLPLAFLLACTDPDPIPPGEWEVRLDCDDPDVAPSCDDGAGGILILEEGAEGEHRTFFPGFPRADGGYTGMPGPATWTLATGQLMVTLLGDLDDPFLGNAERAAWEDHSMVLTGAFESVCWTGRFDWVRTTGEIDATGGIEVVRRGFDCR